MIDTRQVLINRGGIEMLNVRITNHAIERYRNRVDPRASHDEARLVLSRMISSGRARSTPRHWMRHVSRTPGLVFLYWSDLPGVCGLVLNGALITILTREVCNAGKRHLRLVVVEIRAQQPQGTERPLRVVDTPPEAA
jgi:hypothetical protein